jgi:hypothetical protein
MGLSELSLYSIRVRGHFGATMRAAFPEMVMELRGTDCLLTGVLPDRAALFGLLAEIENLSLELVGIRRLAEALNSPELGEVYSP